MDGWKKIEAILFASGKYLSEEELVILSKIPKNKIKKELGTLKQKYSESDTSLAVFEDADGWKLNVKEEFTDVIKEVVSDAEMPRAVMETLAIIAYKSPVLQSEVKDIRGTSIYDHVPLLEKKGFIVREKHGRTFKIKLTPKFHEYFDIEGDSKLAELFKDVKKPDKIGSLEVYESDEDEKDSDFDDKILERMKKLEKSSEVHQEENNFLKDFDEKFEVAKHNIDESEQDIASFRKKTDDDAEQIFKENSSVIENEGDDDSLKVSDSDEDVSIPDLMHKIDDQIDELTKGHEPLSDDELKDISEKSENNSEAENSQDDDLPDEKA